MNLSHHHYTSHTSGVVQCLATGGGTGKCGNGMSQIVRRDAARLPQLLWEATLVSCLWERGAGSLRAGSPLAEQERPISGNVHRPHAVPVFSLSNWETGASDMRDRIGPIPRAAVPLARSSLAITVKEKRKGLRAVYNVQNCNGNSKGQEKTRQDNGTQVKNYQTSNRRWSQSHWIFKGPISMRPLGGGGRSLIYNKAQWRR